MINVQEITKKIIKYLVEGFIVALACFAIPKQSLDLESIGLIALVAAMTFSILDVYIPSMGATARQGAGAGIGLNLVGFPGGL
jgi:ABC-type Co2+ transport system permease subunit